MMALAAFIRFWRACTHGERLAVTAFGLSVAGCAVAVRYHQWATGIACGVLSAGLAFILHRSLSQEKGRGL